jgi:hypothetical protein
MRHISTSAIALHATLLVVGVVAATLSGRIGETSQADGKSVSSYTYSLGPANERSSPTMVRTAAVVNQPAIGQQGVSSQGIDAKARGQL